MSAPGSISAGLPAQPGDLMRRLADLQRQINELAAGPRVSATAFSATTNGSGVFTTPNPLGRNLGIGSPAFMAVAIPGIVGPMLFALFQGASATTITWFLQNNAGTASTGTFFVGQLLVVC